MLWLFLLISGSVMAQENIAKQYVIGNIKYALPADCKVKMNWISPPIEDSIVNKASIYGLCFGVDIKGQPWIGFHNRTVLNPIKRYQFELPLSYGSFTCLDNGAFLFATATDLGFIVPPAKKETGYKDKVTVLFQPISELPLPNCKIYSGAGNILYLVGEKQTNSTYEVYRLKPDKTTVGISLKQYELIFSGSERITAVAGDAETTYIATNYNILRLNYTDKSISKVNVNTLNNVITGLAYQKETGLYFCTDIGVGFIGSNTTIPLLSCVEPSIFIQRGTLYVLFKENMGVLSFDNISNLKFYDIETEPIAATNSTEVKPTTVRFFEGPVNAPQYQDRKYADTFDRSTARYIYGEVYLENLLVQKQKNKQIVSMSLTGPTANYMGIQNIRFDFDINTPALVGWARFGTGEINALYPGDYTLTTSLNKIKIDERKFTITGNVSIVDVASNNDSLKLRKMIAEGAEIDYKNIRGTTALMLTAVYSDVLSTKLLLDKGADVNARNSFGQSPLIDACLKWGDNTPVVKLLLDHGADVNAVDNDGNTPLLLALDRGSSNVVKLLLEKGANVQVKNNKGKTPMQSINTWSIGLENTEKLKLLLKKGSDPNTLAEDGQPLIFKFADVKNISAVAALLSSGANPNAIGKPLLYYQNSNTASLLWYLVDSYTLSAYDPSIKEVCADMINLVYDKGGKFTSEEEKRVLDGNFWQPLPNTLIYSLLERNDEAIKDFVSSDPTIQKLIIKRLINLAYNELVNASDKSGYSNALELCIKAKTRSEEWKLESMIPEVYFNMGLLSYNLDKFGESKVYFEKFLEMSPAGELATKARSFLKKLS